jgi:hypothetical protein
VLTSEYEPISGGICLMIDDPVKKATLKAYLTSGAIFVLSLVVFFYFHKKEDDKAQGIINTLLAQLSETGKRANDAQKSLPELQGQLDALKTSYDDLLTSSKKIEQAYDNLTSRICEGELAGTFRECADAMTKVIDIKQEFKQKVSDTSAKFKILDDNLRGKTTMGKKSELPPIIGNRYSRIYHLSDCPNYNDISDENRILFKTEEAALKAGFRKAKNCP